MLIPGTFHWTEQITIYSVEHVTSGPNTGDTTRTLELSDAQCTVQPASNAELLRHGLDTSRPTYWVRTRPDYVPALKDEVVWRDETYTVVGLSEGLDIDVQFFMRRIQ